MTLVPRPHHRAMAENGIEHLRVLIANERHDRLELLAQVVAGLGHDGPPRAHRRAAVDDAADHQPPSHARLTSRGPPIGQEARIIRLLPSAPFDTKQASTGHDRSDN